MEKLSRSDVRVGTPPPAPFDVNIAHAPMALKMRENLANTNKRATESRRRPPDRKSSKTDEEMKEKCCCVSSLAFLSFL